MAPRLTFVWLGAVLVAGALAGCPSEPAPDRVRLELSEIVTNGAALRPTVRAHRGNKSDSLAPGAYVLRAEPPTVAVVNPDATLACSKSGDARVTVDVKGVTATSTLRCRLVDRLELTELPTLELEKGVVTLAVRVLSKDGSELSDVPIAVSSSNQEPVRIKGTEITPVSVGTTDLVVRAGAVERRFGTRVVRRVAVTPKPLYAGKRVDIDLPAGKFEIAVDLREAKELRMDWRGARQCAYRATGTQHRSTCTLAEKGSVVVDNPAFVATGETAVASDSFVVHEVP